MSLETKLEGKSLILFFTGAINSMTAQEVREWLSPSNSHSMVYSQVLFDVTGVTSMECEAWGEILSLTLETVNNNRSR